MHIAFRTDKPPFNNKEVRRAMMIGTNIRAVHEAVLMMGEWYTFPIGKGVPGHVPLEELPASTRELYDYNPEKARQMLADAGYPDGFTIEMICSPRFDRIGISEMLAGMWKEDLNVKVEVKVLEQVAYVTARNSKDYKDTWICNSHPMLALSNFEMIFVAGGDRNTSHYFNPDFKELYDKAKGTVDLDLRVPMLEELFVMALDDVPVISFGLPHWYCYWWPWVRNYWGEFAGSFCNPPIELMWIDEAMKVDMGY